MPIEIRELLIKATVNESGRGKESSGRGGSNSDKEDIVAECVEQVMEILRQREER